MRRASLLALTALAFACSTPAPPPEPAPAPVVEQPAPSEQKPIGTVRVTATSLNVRADASTSAEVVTQAKKGESLTLLVDKGDWMYVKTAAGDSGWVSAAYVTFGTSSGGRTAKRSKTGCETDYAFVKTPTPAFSDRGAHGLVVVEANVNNKGDVTSTKVISNDTGDESLAFLAEREIKSAKFSPPMRNCVPRAFIFTYKRSF